MARKRKTPYEKAKALLDAFPFTPPEKPFTLKELSKWPTRAERIAHYKEIGNELFKGSDRAAAIMGALFAQDSVNGLVIAHLARGDDRRTQADLTSRDGTLYSFASSIMLAHAMGLIDEKTKMRLDIIRHIRNAFAHSLRPISFETPSIADACRTLDYKPSGPATDQPGAYEALRAKQESMTKAERARYDFLETIFVESGAMSRNVTKYLKSQRRTLTRRISKLEKRLAENKSRVGRNHRH